jgi:ribosomal protein S18 acetylase RimI-like enzyme
MAARAQEPFQLDLLDLRHFQARDLVPLLEEEGRLWLSRLRWDFQPSSEIVRRYVDMRSLSGYALLDGRLPIGYCYYIQEDHKVLIGDLFVSQAYRSLDSQHRLLMQVVDTARHTPGVRRIEAQLLMLESDAVSRFYPSSQLSVFERNFMLADGIAWLSRDRFGPAAPSGLVLDRWGEHYAESVAALIARCYEFHVDSRINDQYRSLAGARRFLHNIIQYPGCGAFHQPAAFVALDAATRQVCGVCLTSLVAPRIGHITQVCVAPERRGQGIGSELLWRSLQAFIEHRCTAVSLTVTASNGGAVRLYERIGFQVLRRFRAYVWEGF